MQRISEVQIYKTNRQITPIVKTGITKLEVDCVVNAANEGLWAGGGACGAVFKEAGYDELTDARKKIGHCDTGSAVITPGFRLKANDDI